jgi:hypothetical protein
MSDDLRQLIEEATRLELNIAGIYLNFHHRFPDDANFWWKLIIEEENHAALLVSGKRYFLDAGMFPAELVGASLAAFRHLNGELERLIRHDRESPMSRDAAFSLAVRLEESVGEIHFQHAMHETQRPTEAIRLFQSLNRADLDHADRIRGYMRDKCLEEAQTIFDLVWKPPLASQAA